MKIEMTIEAAMIELNRLKTTERMDIDRDRLTAAIDVLKDAARFRIKRKPIPEPEPCYGNGCCPNCRACFLDKSRKYCGNCGQALDWGDV